MMRINIRSFVAAVVASVATACGTSTAQENVIPERKETTMIVVHHSGRSTGNAEAFRRFHVDDRGWDDIGYHFVITNGNGGPDGQIQTGREEHLQGAHAKFGRGRSRNSISVGVCLVGGDLFTDAQKDALVFKLTELCRKYDIRPSPETIQGHHEECPGPGLDLKKVVEQVERRINLDRNTEPDLRVDLEIPEEVKEEVRRGESEPKNPRTSLAKEGTSKSGFKSAVPTVFLILLLTALVILRRVKN